MADRVETQQRTRLRPQCPSGSEREFRSFPPIGVPACAIQQDALTTGTNGSGIVTWGHTNPMYLSSSDIYHSTSAWGNHPYNYFGNLSHIFSPARLNETCGSPKAAGVGWNGLHYFSRFSASQQSPLFRTMRLLVLLMLLCLQGGCLWVSS